MCGKCDDIKMGNDFAEYERKQEEAAFEAKMKRDMPADPFADIADLEDKNEWRDNDPVERVTDADIDNDAEKLARDISGGHTASRSTVGRYPCRGCKGTGTIRVYRRGGGWGQAGTLKKCWKGCGGTGYTKTSPEQLAANRDRARRKREEKANRARVAAETFLADNPAMAAWFEKNAGNPSWSFPDELREKLFKYGHLTPGQIGAVEKCLKREEERAAKYAAQEQDGIDLSKMHSGMYAVPGGDTRLKVRIDVVEKGKWAGWVFVKDGAHYGAGKRYGRQRPGGKYQGEIEAELAKIAADPKAAMAAYGHLTSRCGMCNRPLEDEESIERGIGPVCYSRL